MIPGVSAMLSGPILALIDENLVPQSNSSECKVFFLKMKGDYYRYIGEYTRGEDNKKVAQSALEDEVATGRELRGGRGASAHRCAPLHFDGSSRGRVQGDQASEREQTTRHLEGR